MNHRVVSNWSQRVGVGMLFIEPGSPWKNGDAESFAGKLRNELLHGEIFYPLRDARVPIEQWRVHDNAVRPHSALGYRPRPPKQSRRQQAPLRSARRRSKHA